MHTPTRELYPPCRSSHIHREDDRILLAYTMTTSLRSLPRCISPPLDYISSEIKGATTMPTSNAELSEKCGVAAAEVDFVEAVLDVDELVELDLPVVDVAEPVIVLEGADVALPLAELVPEAEAEDVVFELDELFPLA